jgi:hypothetical protein
MASMSTRPLALPADLVEMRRGHIERYGALTLDVVVGGWYCDKCHQHDGISFGTNAACRFDSIEHFKRVAADLAVGKSRGDPPRPCRQCGGTARIEMVQYLAHHSGLGKDLLVVWETKRGLLSRPTVELFEWDLVGRMLPARLLTPAEEARFVRDCRFREAWASFELEDVPGGVALVEDLCRDFPSDRLLLKFVPLLLDQGYGRLSGAIADGHRRIAPDDPEGHFWLGETLFRSVNHKAQPPERLPEARQALERALALKPDHLAAAGSLCNVLRAEGRLAEARAGFEHLLQQHPDASEAHFNLALMVIDDDPALALVHFQRGGQLVPDDPDYPVGVARALVKLGRKDEARQALALARTLTPDHPRFAELDAALALTG